MLYCPVELLLSYCLFKFKIDIIECVFRSYLLSCTMTVHYFYCISRAFASIAMALSNAYMQNETLTDTMKPQEGVKRYSENSVFSSSGKLFCEQNPICVSRYNWQIWVCRIDSEDCKCACKIKNLLSMEFMGHKRSGFID